MSEILGQITHDNKTWNVGYRYGGDRQHQGGYAQCLRIYNSTDKESGHGYFGDDKFEIVSAEKVNSGYMLTLSWPLSAKGWENIVKVGESKEIFMEIK